jgi:hypothetical protein
MTEPQVPFVPGEVVELKKGTWQGEDRLCIKTGYKWRHLCRSLPNGPVWSHGAGFWHVPWVPDAVAHVRAAFPGAKFEGDSEWAQLCLVWKIKSDAQTKAIGSEKTTLSDMPTRHPAWVHQRRAFHFAKDLRASGLFLDMGGGKSAVAVGLCEHDQAKAVLIVCPKSVLGVWPKQFREHAVREWDIWNAGELKGTVVLKAERLAKFLLTDRGRPKVVLVNYDVFWRGAFGDLLKSRKWDVIVYDESHKIKSPGGKASLFAGKMVGSWKRCLLLTGTPTPHGPGDVYAQYRAADPSIYGRNFNHHKKKYFDVRQIAQHVDKIVGFRDERARDEFQSKMGSIGILIPREDMVGVAGERWSLPPVERQCKLDIPTYKAYCEVRDDLVTQVEEGLVTADNVLVKGLRLRQATSGFLRTEDGIDSVIGTEKAELLAEVLDDIPERRRGGKESNPIVVFGVFHHDLDVIQAVAERCGRVYGELSGRRRDGLASDSTLAPGVDVMGCQLQSGGVGIDLTRSCFGVYYSIDYNLGNVEQSQARLDRPGQTRPVTFIHLVAVSPVAGMTVDGVTYKALRERKALNVAVLEAIRAKEA